MKIYTKDINHREEWYPNIEKIKIMTKYGFEIVIDPEKICVDIGGAAYIYSEFKELIKPLKLDRTRDKEKKITINDILKNKNKNAAKERVKLDPVTEYWNKIYENFRNIVNQFWKDDNKK